MFLTAPEQFVDLLFAWLLDSTDGNKDWHISQVDWENGQELMAFDLPSQVKFREQLLVYIKSRLPLDPKTVLQDGKQEEVDRLLTQWHTQFPPPSERAWKQLTEGTFPLEVDGC